ncbi:ankyrin repeat-containing protein, putative [Entamoeba invadens IP1]|uniref:Ankyrin repeat-containing protein, putative n=1 Tax=Entamoeba invadens IP1 TaxID=370355 RepID=A0A0A1TXR8_ENTIV|nr:ankyrin repeat-containing protein, putative [Entamoeba invadens IP1]ELP86187.1 ankyrin repeat-containing protein, putative [Entamoeba invadens IP1]|eukprot:XP_004185533.1 ankyrin repeat-containing protein, putative [Entamoeba invadens IP1]
MSLDYNTVVQLLEELMCGKGSIRLIRKMCETTQGEGTSTNFVKDMLVFLEVRGQLLGFMSKIFDSWVNGNDSLLFVIRKNLWSYNCFMVYLHCSNGVEYLQKHFQRFFIEVSEEITPDLRAEYKEVRRKSMRDEREERGEERIKREAYIRKQNEILQNITSSNLEVLEKQPELFESVMQYVTTLVEKIVTILIDSVTDFPGQVAYYFSILQLKIINGYVNTSSQFILYLFFEGILVPFLSQPVYYGMMETVTNKQMYILNICIFVLRNIGLNTPVRSGYFSVFNEFIQFQHTKLMTRFFNVICQMHPTQTKYPVTDEEFQRACYRLIKTFTTCSMVLEQSVVQNTGQSDMSTTLKKIKESSKLMKKLYKEKTKPIGVLAPFQSFGKKLETLEQNKLKMFNGLSPRTLAANLRSKKSASLNRVLSQNRNYINYADSKTGLTPIMFACKNQEIEIFKALLRLNPNYFLRDFRGWSIAHHIFFEKRIDLSVLLMESPFLNLFDWNDDLNTPLHYLVQFTPCTQQLQNCILTCLQNGADINSLNLSRETPLFRAIKKRNFDVVKMLLLLGADPFVNCKKWTPYEFVLEDSQDSEIRNLVLRFAQHGVLSDSSYVRVPQIKLEYSREIAGGVEDLFVALEKHDPMMFDVLLDSHRNEDEKGMFHDGNTMLHEICRSGDTEILNIYITKRFLSKQNVRIPVVKVNEEGETPLMTALRKNRGECALVLLSYNIDNLTETINTSNGRNILHYVADAKIPSEIKSTLFLSLIIRMVNINQQDKNGNTPLHLLLMQKEDVKLTELLLMNGADMFIENKRQQQCIHISIENKDVANFNFLFEHEYEWVDEDFEFYHTLYTDDCTLLIPHVINYLVSINASSPVHKWEIVLKMKRLLDLSGLFDESKMVNGDPHIFTQQMAIKYESETLSNQLKECLMKDQKDEEVVQEDWIRERINMGISQGIKGENTLKISIEMLKEDLQRCLNIQNSLLKKDTKFDVHILQNLVKKLYFAAQQANAQYYTTSSVDNQKEKDNF